MDIFNANDELKNAVLKGVCLVFGVIAIILSAANLWFANAYLLATFEIFYSAFCFYLLYLLKQQTIKEWQFYANALMLTVLIIYGIATTKVNSGLIYWSFCLPAVFHIFFPLRQAITFVALIFSSVVLIMFNKTGGQFAFPILNYAFLFIAIWAISCAHELSRLSIQNALQTAALTDQLTQAKNRRALANDITHNRFSCGNYYAICIDIDHFKNINDKFGHHVGDQVLIHFVSLLRLLFSGAPIYRLGGEEFLVFAQSSSKEQLEIKLESILNKIASSSYPLDNESVAYTASFGVAHIDENLKLDSAINIADGALYRAKNNGRNQVQFS